MNNIMEIFIIFLLAVIFSVLVIKYGTLHFQKYLPIEVVNLKAEVEK